MWENFIRLEILFEFCCFCIEFELCFLGWQSYPDTNASQPTLTCSGRQQSGAAVVFISLGLLVEGIHCSNPEKKNSGNHQTCSLHRVKYSFRGGRVTPFYGIPYSFEWGRNWKSTFAKIIIFQKLIDRVQKFFLFWNADIISYKMNLFIKIHKFLTKKNKLRS